MVKLIMLQSHRLAQHLKLHMVVPSKMQIELNTPQSDIIEQLLPQNVFNQNNRIYV